MESRIPANLFRLPSLMHLQSQISNLKSESGRRYWRSLDEVAESPEFRQWLEREFPGGASEWTDPVTRRHFVKIMSASFLLAGLGLAGSGCRRPVDRLEPFGKQPEDYVFGTSQWYATSRPTRAGAVPLVARSYEGRPVKVEGNALYPGGNGGTDRWTQASILDLYDPDRSRRFVRGGSNVTPEAAQDFLTQLSRQALAGGGAGLAFLLERNTSPSRARLQELIGRKFPQAKWFVHEAMDLDIHRRAASEAFGAPVRPVYRYDFARTILSLDCDFIGSEEDTHESIRRFAQVRRLDGPSDDMCRLYAVESLFTLTGLNADHRLRVPSAAIPAIAAAFASAILKPAGGPMQNLPAGVDPRWISECAKDLAANGHHSLVVAGHRQPREVHLLAHALNAALGSIGTTVVFQAAAAAAAGGLAELVQALEAGQVNTLVMLGGNPAYSAPSDLDWAGAQRRAGTVVRLAYYEDETFVAARGAGDWHLPAAHYLESWGDARTADGTLVPIQPLIAPLFGGLTELEVLARIAGETVTSPYEIVRETFAQIAGGTDAEGAWRKFLYNGFLDGSAAKPVEVQLAPDVAAKALERLPALTSPTRDSLEVVLCRDYKLDDGRFANNGWLLELPDPVTKLTWDNAVLISRKTAHELGLKNGDVVEITLAGRSVSGAVWVQPGMADYSLGLSLGYGRDKAGRVGSGVGFNAGVLRRSTAMNQAVGATLRPLGRQFPLACTQHHWSMEGRPIIREANLELFRAHPDFAQKEKLEEPPVVASLYPNPLDRTKRAGLQQWGMAIDLNACVGCETCIVACQSENNIPIVGKDQVLRGREMHWMRVDRYYAATPGKGRLPDVLKIDQDEQFEKWIDDPQAVVQPMPCQHCEAAPCENVCPVNATTHDDEGLNLMVYNRCVGTRYCSNNCPYKVRRFNFLDYNKRPLKDLKGPFYATPMLHSTEGEWDLLRWWKNPMDPTAGMRPEDEWDLIKMIKNPDVTVRMRGVMEKCTFCVQRIEQARIAQKVKAGASGDVRLKESEGTIPKTACQQACPAGAIMFGDISDPDSSVSRWKKQQRNYSVLDNLFTRPRTTYLAVVRNPNPAMPDYREIPATFEEFEERLGNPFEESGESAAGGKERAHG
jgi:MoCo/4Fe-4S cofactor protein with predicted Tat translocation signal